MGKTLVTGSLGQLGSELRELVGNDRNWIFTDALPNEETLQLDICDSRRVRELMEGQDVDLIINCAAYTNVDKAESEKELSFKINAEGPKVLAECVRERNAALVHISTDYVFDGKRKRGAYRESDPCRPQSVYGATKRQGELAIRRSRCRGVIIRTAWLYSSYGNNFVKTMVSLGSERSEIGVVADQIGTPTYARDLAKAILTIIPQIGEHRGDIYHYTNEGSCTWFDFAALIMTYCGLDCKVNPLTTEEYPTAARRPAYSVLDKSKIREEFGVETPWWSISLREALRKMGKPVPQHL
ncbi:MAG TPA: dTDP-4-dehydrorhamnose reductase [Bacteroidales bacterium]|nr:dTDP-4-dehydrorhamnose reductase [Bacteroidales bacterium]HPK29930.1 dTDP-4-dehydrorhamnose reductase [Bacteroidales bacterium]